MKIRLLLPSLLSIFAVFLGSLTNIAIAQETVKYSGPSRDLQGNIVPKPKGDRCIRPVDEMRTSHMELLLHKRDQTMYQGIRTEDASLVECINCHATPASDGKIARTSDQDSQHFCVSCHVAAAVTLDCFECHADRPVEAFSGLPAIQEELQGLQLYNPHSEFTAPYAVLHNLKHQPTAVEVE